MAEAGIALSLLRGGADGTERRDDARRVRGDLQYGARHYSSPMVIVGVELSE